MKRYISAILVPCLLMQFFGCYSLQPLESGEDINEYLKSPDLQIALLINDGRRIKADISDLKFITNQKYILYGPGTSLNKVTQERKYFEGELNEEDIDSLKYISLDSKDYLVCWLKDSMRISLDHNKSLVSTLNPDSTYWLVKSVDPPALIPVGNIYGYEIDKFDLGDTIALILGIVAVIAVSAAAIYENIHSGLTTGTLGN